MSALVLPGNLFFGEPPDAIKHVRWCERGRLQSRPLLDRPADGALDIGRRRPENQSG